MAWSAYRLRGVYRPRQLVDEPVGVVEHREPGLQLEVLRARPHAFALRDRDRLRPHGRREAWARCRRVGWPADLAERRVVELALGQRLVRIGQPDRRGWKLLGHRLVDGERCSGIGGSVQAELGEIDLVDRRHPLLGPTKRRVAAGTVVHLAAGGVAVTRPDELVDDDRAPARRASRRVELVEVLPQRYVDSA